MKHAHGSLSDHFAGVGAKKLSAVEVDGNVSHQHELNGATALRNLFGTPEGKVPYPATFMYVCDDDADPVVDDGSLTWYDARANHATRTEYRCYYTPNLAFDCAEAGDTIFVALQHDKTLLVIIAEAESTIGSQLAWLFGVQVKGTRFATTTEFDTDMMAYTSRLVLQQIGVVEPPFDPDGALEDMLRRFGRRFPSTQEFSNYARSTVLNLHPGDDGDDAIVTWVDQEDRLFRILEDHIISDRISSGFEATDDFVAYALSTMNRRKPRAGHALENHLRALFVHRDIEFSPNPITENRERPDFIFPSIGEYRDPRFPDALLTMLGAKTTLKDRWRQVLNEASRITDKHLITLQPAISVHQTSEMEKCNLHLVVPLSIQETYQPSQRDALMSVDQFIDHVTFNQRSRQRTTIL